MFLSSSLYLIVVMEYQLYADVLDYLPNHSVKIRDDIYSDNTTDSIIDVVERFCKESIQKTFVVSLSGGVDSMVLVAIIHHLGYDVVGAHLNYNNRNETALEQQFLEQWCLYNNIPLYVKCISDLQRASGIKRSDYELHTKTVRFAFYEEILQNEEADSVLLAHHKDDSVENILTNLCRARSILNLAVFKQSSSINNVVVVRPLLDVFKHTICNFAHNNDIPYFKDTTPSWSIRGILRTHIMPALAMAFKTTIKENLLRLNQQTSEWNELIRSNIVDPYITLCEFRNDEAVIPIGDYATYPMCFWNTVFMEIFYRYKHNCPSNKSVASFVTFVRNKTSGNFALSNKCSCYLNEDSTFVIRFL